MTGEFIPHVAATDSLVVDPVGNPVYCDLHFGDVGVEKFVITAKAHTPVGSMLINGDNTRLSHGLLQLLGIQKLSPITFVKRLTAPSTYFVHCDLIDKRQNLLNEKPSTVLARFDIRGQPFEKVHYQTPQQHVLRETDSGDYDVNSITLSVKDKNGNLFDFNNQPLEFEVEINETPIYTHQHGCDDALGPCIQRGSTTIPYARVNTT